MSSHVHAENMLLYAHDAMETEEPWKRWEHRVEGGKWTDFHTDPLWNPHIKYRRKLKTIMVNGHEVVAPEAEAPPCGTEYHTFCISYRTSTEEYKWADDSFDRSVLNSGFLFLKEKDAEAYMQALLDYKKD